MVTPSMPKNTAVPSAWRISAPAPVASASGTTPKMKANDVIRMGRSLVLRRLHGRIEAVGAALLGLFGELDDQDGVLGGQADQHHEADLGQDVVVHAAQQNAADRRKQTHRHDQDHRERKQHALVLRGKQQEHEHDGKTERHRWRYCRRPSPAAQSRSIRSRSPTAGSAAAMRSIAAMAWPVEKPGNVEPCTSAAGNRL